MASGMLIIINIQKIIIIIVHSLCKQDSTGNEIREAQG
jgi:hypothetical protein